MAEALPMGLAGDFVTLCAGVVTCPVVSSLEGNRKIVLNHVVIAEFDLTISQIQSLPFYTIFQF